MAIYTSESVTEGHPDKVCDQISDSILDAYLAKDSRARVAVECLISGNTLVIAGEVTSKANVSVKEVALATIRRIGYTKESGFDCDSAKVEVILQRQSPDISQGVDQDGAGDQGMMYGYACDETPDLMPLPIWLAHKLAQRLSEVRKQGIIANLCPDGKTQVSVLYENNVPKEVTGVVIAQQHTANISEEELAKEIKQKVILPICKEWITKKTKIFINATGSFVIGGPAADTGLTGRKIIVDTYGGIGRHGGGAFSGKDPTKVDRSAAYMARHIAKNIVASGFAKRCELQLSYCIGVAQPTSIAIDTFGTNTIPEKKIVDWVQQFDLSPKGIINYLELRRPIFAKTAAYGHFGREGFPWEQIIE